MAKVKSSQGLVLLAKPFTDEGRNSTQDSCLLYHSSNHWTMFPGVSEALDHSGLPALKKLKLNGSMKTYKTFLTHWKRL